MISLIPYLLFYFPDKHDELEAPSMKTDTRAIFVSIFSCISILLLFLVVIVIYRCSQNGSSPEESTNRYMLGIAYAPPNSHVILQGTHWHIQDWRPKPLLLPIL
nr:V-set and transmembrane domain-containing protein 1-like isoform X1 [Aotus nancymaae]